MVDLEMTVLLGFIDQDGDVVLGADGKSSDSAGRSYEDALKIARFAPNTAVGFSGLPYYGNQIFANIMQLPELVAKTENVRIVRELERMKRLFDLTTLAEITGVMDKWLAHLLERFDEESKKRDNVLKIKVAFLGGVVDGGKSHLVVWSKETGWKGYDATGQAPVIFCPDGSEHYYKEAAAILCEHTLTIRERVSRAIALYADDPEFASKVNHNVTMRRASTGFELERLY